MTERPNVPVLKTGVVRATVGSNPTLSATYGVKMPKTKRISQSKLRELRQKRKASPLPEEETKPDFRDIYVGLGEAIAGLINNHATLRLNVDKDNFLHHASLLTQALIGPYQSRNFNLSIAKNGVEIWLHKKHARKEMTLQEIGAYIAGPVDEREISEINCSTHPWSPKHLAGELIWRAIFEFAGVINNQQNDLEVKINLLNKIREPGNYIEFLSALKEGGKYKVDPRFLIEPGKVLTL